MKRVLAFGASNSSQSINKKLAVYASSMLTIETSIIDLNDFEMPIFSVDRKSENGAPQLAKDLKEIISTHDGIIISLAEHNGAYSTAFKNIFDWLSILDGKTWDNKPMLLLATSPGVRGGSSVLEIAANRFPFNGGLIVNTFSLPSFGKYFDVEKGIVDEEKKKELLQKVHALEKSIA